MQVRIDLLNRMCQVCGLRVFIQVFDVEREAVISGKCGEEAQELLAEIGCVLQGSLMTSPMEGSKLCRCGR